MLRQNFFRLRFRAPLAAAAIAAAAFAFPQTASAGIFDFLFGDQPAQRAEPPASVPGAPSASAGAYADPLSQGAPSSSITPVAGGGGGRYTFCVRTCDGRYFPLTSRGGAAPAQICSAFCPASPTKVYSGNAIESASTFAGERYADSANAFAFRKSLKADCTCNGRDAAGLAPVDLTLDTTLRPGDVIATSHGLVAYSGSRTANGQTAEFTPIASYPGLTGEVRARLGVMKVAPVNADIPEDTYSSPETTSSIGEVAAPTSAISPLPPAIDVPKIGAVKAKRADVR